MNFTDIQNQFYFLTKTNSSSCPVSDQTHLVKKAQSRITSLIMTADGRWEWDDSNQTDLPVGTTNLVSGQQDYSLASTHLGIRRVEVKDTNGNWSQLKPFDNTDYNGQSITALASQTGTPSEYDLLGSSVFLLAVPNYSQSASLKFYFERGPLEFDYTLGTFSDASGGLTSTPGFNALYHPLIPLWMAYDYAIANGLQNANQIFVEIQRLEAALLADYGRRNKDDRPRMTMSMPPSFK